MREETKGAFRSWEPIRLWCEGMQKQLARYHYCEPAWDINAIYDRPDEEVPPPDGFQPRDKSEGPPPPKAIFWDRHIDPRFHIEYPLASREAPRHQGQTIGDPDREWEVLIEHRDRYLAEKGLTCTSDDEEIARCLADTFSCDSHFGEKPLCTTFGDAASARGLHQAIEGLLHKSFCMGCGMAVAALMDSRGLPARVIGLPGHVLAEVFAGGRWHMVDSAGRHERNRGIDMYFKSSFVDSMLAPFGDHGDHIPDDYRIGLWKRRNPQFHLMLANWMTSLVVNYTAGTARACYPEAVRYGILSNDGKRLPLIKRSVGFFHPRLHDSVHREPEAEVIARALPERMPQEAPVGRHFLYHQLQTGERLRQSLWLGNLVGCRGIEVVIPFGASRRSDFSTAVGTQLFIKVNDFRASLAELNAWPPALVPDAGNLHTTFTLPTDAFTADAVNWIEFENRSDAELFAALVPAALEPYVPPLWK